jgi:hypothetical protein
MPQSDWLSLNGQRAYPFVTNADFTVTAGSLIAFDGDIAFVDAGFTLGIASAFEHARDHIYLDRYYYDGTLIRFIFRVSYGLAASYEAMQCYEWVFEFDVAALTGTTVYAVPTRVTDDLAEIGEENPAMGLGFLTIGRLDIALTPISPGVGFFDQQPQVEPAVLQNNVNTFVEKIAVANEARPCPPECVCEESSSSSSSSSSDESSSSSSSSGACEDPVPPEPAELNAPTRVPLPGGSFLDAVLLKPGYNCQITVVEAQRIVTIAAGLNKGEGMQCEDLRTAEDGSLIPATCVDCGNLVYAVNSHGFDVEHLQFVGGPGVVITPDAENHRVYVRLEEEGICEVEV